MIFKCDLFALYQRPTTNQPTNLPTNRRINPPHHSNAVLPTESSFAKIGVKQPGAAPPTTPLEKYKLRIQVGRLTGRMDLSCKAMWGSAPTSASTATAAAAATSASAAAATATAAATSASAVAAAAATSAEGEGSPTEEGEGAETVGDGQLAGDTDEDAATAAADSVEGGPKGSVDSAASLSEGGAGAGGGGRRKGGGKGSHGSSSSRAELEISPPEGIFEQVASTRGGGAGGGGEGEVEDVEGIVAAISPTANASLLNSHSRSQKKAKKAMTLDFRLSVIPIEVLRLTGKRVTFLNL
jgi:hypothetical protein